MRNANPDANERPHRQQEKAMPIQKRVLIVGAGEAGASLALQMQQNPQAGYVPVGFIDDDPEKAGEKIAGIVVLGNRTNIPEQVRSRDVEVIMIAMPSVKGEIVRSVLMFCDQTQAKVKILPGIWEIIHGQAHLWQVRDFQPEDLLGRETVEVALEQLAPFYQNKTVLVTGACGTIGREILRRLQRLPVGQVIAMDRNENELYYLKNRALFPQRQGAVKETDQPPVEICFADITNQNKVDAAFAKYRPQIVFHAAAYKHVSLMESFPRESFENNVLGTWHLAQAASRYGVETFALISTDKAVHPESIMGLTKRLAEILVEQMNRQNQTRFFSVRFGNVLGSSGSVVPIMRAQIEAGGPVTVTHPDVKRFFMTKREAVELITLATTQAVGGEVFVLDMGEQVRIDDLARRMIRLMGYLPDREIKIQYIGLRPGEKMEEALFEDRQAYESSGHEKILVRRKPEARGFLARTIREQQMLRTLEGIVENEFERRLFSDLLQAESVKIP